MKKIITFASMSLIVSLLFMRTEASDGVLQIYLNNKFVNEKTYTSGTFTDSSSSDWFEDAVISAYEVGIINGRGNNIFDPDGNVSNAEVVKIAAVIHSKFNDKEIVMTSSDKWYAPYYSYAVTNGIISSSDLSTADEYSSREELFGILSNAIPQGAYPKINDLPYQDQLEDFSNGIKSLAEAGIITGDLDADFKLNDYMRRNEICVIVSKILDTELRDEDYPIEDENYYSVSAVSYANGEITLSHSTAKQGTQVTFTITPSDGYSVNRTWIKEGDLKTEITGNSFVMGRDDVEITAEFIKVDESTLSTIPTINGYISIPKTVVSHGETIQISVFPSTGYELDFLYVVEGDTTTLLQNESYTSTGVNAQLGAVFKESITYTPSKMYNVYDGSVPDFGTLYSVTESAGIYNADDDSYMFMYLVSDLPDSYKEMLERYYYALQSYGYRCQVSTDVSYYYTNDSYVVIATYNAKSDGILIVIKEDK